MMTILKGDKFNNGALVVTAVTPIRVKFCHVGTGYPHDMTKYEFYEQMDNGVFHTQERRVKY